MCTLLQMGSEETLESVDDIAAYIRDVENWLTAIQNDSGFSLDDSLKVWSLCLCFV